MAISYGRAPCPFPTRGWSLYSYNLTRFTPRSVMRAARATRFADQLPVMAELRDAEALARRPGIDVAQD